MKTRADKKGFIDLLLKSQQRARGKNEKIKKKKTKRKRIGVDVEAHCVVNECQCPGRRETCEECLHQEKDGRDRGEESAQDDTAVRIELSRAVVSPAANWSNRENGSTGDGRSRVSQLGVFISPFRKKVGLC